MKLVCVDAFAISSVFLCDKINDFLIYKYVLNLSALDYSFRDFVTSIPCTREDNFPDITSKSGKSKGYNVGWFKWSIFRVCFFVVVFLLFFFFLFFCCFVVAVF